MAESAETVADEFDPELPVGVPDSGRWRSSERTLMRLDTAEAAALSFHKGG